MEDQTDTLARVNMINSTDEKPDVDNNNVNADLDNDDHSAPASLRELVDFRRRLSHTAVFYFGFFVFGWVVGQRGAAFLDLLLVTDTDVTLGSILFTLAGLSSIAGGMVGGFLLDITGRPLLMMTSIFITNAAVNSTLALCKPLALMSTLYFISHFALSVYDVVVNPHLASIWPVSGSDGFLQGLHFTFSVGAVLSPLATQPFLAPRMKDTHLIPIEEIEQEFTGHKTDVEHPESMFSNGTSGLLNTTGVYEEDTGLGTNRETKVLFALLISGILCLIAGILISMLMLFPVSKLTHSDKSEKKSAQPGKTQKLYYAALVMLGVYNFFGSSVEDVFPHYLMTFVVRALDWSKTSGAHITSVYWVGLSVGRFSGVGLVRVLSPTKILLGCLMSMIISLLIFLVAAIFEAHWAVWIGAGAVGLSTSVLFPTGLIYAHQRVTRLTGKVSAIIFTTPMIAAMANPLIVVTLMTRYSNLWYIYVFLLETVLALCCFLALHALSSRLAINCKESHVLRVELEDKEERERAQCLVDNSETVVN